MFSRICDPDNIRAAYLEIVDSFAQDRKNLRYHGLDNLSLPDYDLDSRSLLATVRMELLQKKEIEPALSIRIPKKSNPNKFREIFIYNIKERVKAQALARVLLPDFENNFSDRLFSYRPGKPPYLAAKNFCHRYRRAYASDWALVMDLENYSDLVDKDLLYQRLQEIFKEPDVLDCLRLFIYNKVCRNGEISQPAKGLVQGVPLIALFANLYLSDLDFKYQYLVPFYIRVGDDIALLDKDVDKLRRLQTELTSDLESRGLVVNPAKLFFGPAKEEFGFLGYNFLDGQIRLEQSFVRRTESEWKKILSYKHLSESRKDDMLRKIMSRPEKNFNFMFNKIVRDKQQVNDSEQIKRLSESFFRIMTRFFFGHYSPRRRRLLAEKLAAFKIKSLYFIYKQFHYERD